MVASSDAAIVESDSVQRWGEVAPPVEDEALNEALLDDTATTPFLMNSAMPWFGIT